MAVRESSDGKGISPAAASAPARGEKALLEQPFYMGMDKVNRVLPGPCNGAGYRRCRL